MTRRTTLVAGLVVCLAVAGCGGGGSAEPFPNGSFAIQAASDIGVGTYRVLIGIAGPDNTRLGSSDQPVTIEVAPQDDPERSQSAEGSYTSIVPGVGLYRAEFDFDSTGTWTVTVTPESGDQMTTALTVLEQTLAPPIGAKAPRVATPTLDDLPIEELTSDAEPLDDLYSMSLDDALASGRPTVLTFSTPAFCRTEACGPLLEVVKSVVPDNPQVNFVHVEVYAGFTSQDFSPDDPSFLAPAVVEYGLPSEPWIFVIDPSGTIVGRFEGVVARDELEQILGTM